MCSGNCSGSCTCGSNSSVLPIGATGAQGGYGGYSGEWIFSTSIVATPSSTQLRLNNATPSAVTQIFVSDTGVSSVNYDLFLDSLANSSNFGLVRIFNKANSTKFWMGRITAVTDNGTDHTLTVTYISSNGTFAASDALILSFADAGTQGTQGGFGGYSASWLFSTATTNNPTSGQLRLNDPTAASTTEIYINKTDEFGTDLSAFLDSFDNDGNFGMIRVFTKGIPTLASFYRLTNVTLAGSVYTLTVTYVSGIAPQPGTGVVITFSPSGQNFKWTPISLYNGITDFVLSVTAVTSNQTVATFIYPGTNSVNPILQFKANLFTNNVTNTATVRIQDITNSLTIATGTSTGLTSNTIITLGAVSNLPTGPAVFAIQLSANTGVFVSSIGSLLIGQYL